MTGYLFIETRDPFESRDTQFDEETASAVKERGHEVTVFLVQNGVLASRKSIGLLRRLPRVRASTTWIRRQQRRNASPLWPRAAMWSTPSPPAKAT